MPAMTRFDPFPPQIPDIRRAGSRWSAFWTGAVFGTIGKTGYDFIHGDRGTIDASVLAGRGGAGEGLVFPGSDNAIAANVTWPDEARFDFSDACTLCVLAESPDWSDFSAGAMGEFAFLIAKSNWASSRSYRIRVESSAGDEIRWQVSNDGNDPGANEAVYATSNLPGGTPLLMHFTREPDGTLRIFVDGVEVASGTGDTGTIFNGTADFSIGASADDGDTEERDQFNGTIYMALAWSRVLSPAEIRHHSVDPYAPLRPARRMVPVIAAGAAPGADELMAARQEGGEQPVEMPVAVVAY